VTLFSRFRSQPSGNTGGEKDTLRLHDTMRTGESIQRVKLETRMPCAHTLWFSRSWDVFFFNLGPHALEMLRALRYLNPAQAVDTVIWYLASLEKAVTVESKVAESDLFQLSDTDSLTKHEWSLAVKNFAATSNQW